MAQRTGLLVFCGVKCSAVCKVPMELRFFRRLHIEFDRITHSHTLAVGCDNVGILCEV